MEADKQNISKGIEFLQEQRGHNLRRSADRETQLRTDWSPLLGISVALDDGTNLAHTLVNTAVTIRLDISDIKDGRDGKESNGILGIMDSDPIAVAAGQRDQKADKIKYRSQMLGLIARTLAFESDPRQAGFLGINLAVQTARDFEMQRTRNQAMKHDIKANARDIGRLKAWFNGGGAGLHTLAPMLPEKYKQSVTKVGNILHVIGTGLSVAALIDMKTHVRRGLKSRMPEGDTIQGRASGSRQAGLASVALLEHPYAGPRSLNL